MSKQWRIGSKRFLIAELLRSGKTKMATYLELRPMVESQLEPMVFKANIHGSRRAKPMSEQLIELRHEVNRVARIVELDDDSFDGLSDNEIPESESELETPEIEIESPESEDDEEESEEESGDESETVRPVKAVKAKLESELRYFLRRVREIRAKCEERAKLSEAVDWISMRPVQAAAKLIPAGIPADALLYAMAMHWPEDTRRDFGIADFDFVALSKRIIRERGITTLPNENGEDEDVHFLFGYALILAENRIPIMLVGPAGTGKSHIARQLATYLELPYGETPMSPGATRGDLLGRHTLSGFVLSQFAAIYSGGGVFNFEEIDASDASMLIVLNNALASQSLYNSADGELYTRSGDFIAISTANTFGLGATRDYNARERLDAATIDRWRMGRIFVSLDENVEESILGITA